MQPVSYRHTAGYESMIAYVIYQALLDLKSTNSKVKLNAKNFLLSEDGQTFCEAIGFDYHLITKIDFNNPENSLDFN